MRACTQQHKEWRRRRQQQQQQQLLVEFRAERQQGHISTVWTATTHCMQLSCIASVPPLQQMLSCMPPNMIESSASVNALSATSSSQQCSSPPSARRACLIYIPCQQRMPPVSVPTMIQQSLFVWQQPAVQLTSTSMKGVQVPASIQACN
jgi:hypothetical protein